MDKANQDLRWRKVLSFGARGPYCWQEIDIEEWSKNRCPDKLDRMLQLRSGCPRKLCVSGLSQEPSFSFIANNAKSLQMLQLPKSEIELLKPWGSTANISLVCVEQCIPLRHLELLDVRGCWNFVKKFNRVKVVGPVVVDCYCSDYSSSSGYVPWDFVAGDVDDDDFDEMSNVYWEDDDQDIEDVEMWFYDDLNGYDWPQSP
ncbi:hypothetical protein K7X08_016839 [Anisodus acutangulus]|uniref:Uncharacterized protein n=1 Tax=Anisodus acutangulus TaxID=402998 RepID=A0A9Q1LU69_9SOLA|nr:hypothetical protein K7X08_016839 [Anisodus acutangulus]